MAMSGPNILQPRPDAAPFASADAEPTLSPGGTPSRRPRTPRTPRPPRDPYRFSGVGIAAGTATIVNLLSASVLGTQLSGFLGSNASDHWSQLPTVVFVGLVVLFLSLAVALVTTVVLGKRGGSSARTALIFGLLLLLPPTGVAFYVVNQTLMK
jgi:hypothetical protein